MESPPTIPRARESASHDEDTLSTLRHSSAGEETVKLKELVAAQQQQIEEHQETIIALQERIGVYEHDNASLVSLTRSLEERLAECKIESERFREKSEQHKRELHIFLRTYAATDSAKQEKHATQLKTLQEKIDLLESRLVNESMQCVKLENKNKGLVRLVGSLNLCQFEIEIDFTRLSCELADSKALLRSKCREHKRIVDALVEELDIFKRGSYHVTNYLQKLASRPTPNCDASST
jgi:hypothetical protein